jgi:YVTN family beta-propeller protein
MKIFARLFLTYGGILPAVIFAQYIETTIPIRYGPLSLCWNAANNKVYCSPSLGDVLVIDGASNEVLQQILIGDRLKFLTWDSIDNKLFGIGIIYSRVIAISCSTHRIQAFIPADGVDLTWNAINNKVYTTNIHGVTVIDGATNQVLKNVPVGIEPWSIIWTPTNKVYCANYNIRSSSVTVIDGATDEVLATVPVGRSPYALFWNATNNKVYCANYDNDTVTVIDGESNEVVAMVPVGRAPRALVWNATNNKVYCANEVDNTVTVIDGVTDEVVATVRVGTSPGALLWNPITNRVYCGNLGSDSITVIDGATDEVLTTIQVGRYPNPSCLNLNQSKIYVASHSGITVIRDLVPGIEQMEQYAPGEPHVTVFPNPAKDVFTVQTSSTIQNLRLYDATGKLIRTYQVSQPAQYSLKGINPGVYFLGFDTKRGEITRKLIVQ